MSLEDKLNQEFAAAWRPEPGGTIIGKVVEIATLERDWGPYPCITIEQDSGERLAVHAFHGVLQSELQKIRPQVGHRIGIKYFGKPEGKNYERYSAASENTPEYNWGDKPPESDIPNDWAAAPGTVPSGARSSDDEDIPF